MSQWHIDWQNNFTMIEIPFRKIENQHKERRADIVIEKNKQVVEIQHSEIKKLEVNARFNDYTMCHKYDIIWVIDGTDTILVKELNHCNRIYLEFESEPWKFNRFLRYDCIFIDINNMIYKVNPNKVKSNMIDVSQPLNKSDFINLVNDNVNNWYDEHEPEQCKLFIKQQGAGNGKTWGSIQLLDNDDYLHYKNFIYVTKQHSAKFTIYQEFLSQLENNAIESLELLEDPIITNKKYVVKYLNKKTEEECQLIIATIDSLMYAIGNKNISSVNKFEAIVNSIIENNINAGKDGTIKYAQINPKLNKETLLIIDETQDLSTNYAKAIIQIMRNRYIDTYVIGDKLQSIVNINNAFTFLFDNELPYIEKIIDRPTNICRRFNNNYLVNFVNNIIPFNKYDLPEIKQQKSLNDESLIIFNGNTVLNSDSNKNKINHEVEVIMDLFEKEVNFNNRIPEDFLIITPFVTTNILIYTLYTAIRQFWINKFCKDINYIENVLNNDNYWKDNNTIDNYTEYCVLHKSEDGNSINLEESVHSTRIVSIHTSKGDGRKVVFLIGLTDSAIKRYSTDTDNLIYDSLIHVSLTRMKETLYLRIENIDDNFTNNVKCICSGNIIESSEVIPNIDINTNIKYTSLTNNMKTNAFFSLIENNIIKYNNLQKIDDNQCTSVTIDLTDHIARYCALFIKIFTHIASNDINNVKKQSLAILLKIQGAQIKECTKWEDYFELLNKITNNKSLNKIPILKLTDEGNNYYDEYFNIIKRNIINIQNNIGLIINGNYDLCSYESIMLTYMIDINENGNHAQSKMLELYKCTHSFYTSFNNDTLCHDNCLCKSIFTNSNSTDQLFSHYNKINIIDEYLDNINNKYLNLSWLWQHYIEYIGKDKKIKLWKRIPLIGYNDNDVIICYVKPQFNNLNYNEILIDSIYDTYFMLNLEEETENYSKFNNKTLTTCVISLDREPYFINWDNINENFIKETLNNLLTDYFKTHNKNIKKFYTYYKNKNINLKNKDKTIKKVIDKYNEKNETKNIKPPTYVGECLLRMKFELEYISKTENKIEMLNRYDDNLNNMLDSELKNYLEEYLGLCIDEDEDECKLKEG